MLKIKKEKVYHGPFFLP